MPRAGSPLGIATPEGLFGGALTYAQPEKGYRTSVDSLALMAFAAECCGAAAPGSILDIGCGAGFCALVAARLWPESRTTGVEISRTRARFARKNVVRNRLGGRVRVLDVDMGSAGAGAPAGLPGAPFDLIVSNPPFFPTGQGTLPADPDTALARFELRLTLRDILRSAARWLAPGGRLAWVYPARRLEEVEDEARRSGLWVTRVQPVAPKIGRGSTHILVLCRSGAGEEVGVERDLQPWLFEGPGRTLGPELAALAFRLAGPSQARGRK